MGARSMTTLYHSVVCRWWFGMEELLHFENGKVMLTCGNGCDWKSSGITVAKETPRKVVPLNTWNRTMRAKQARTA
jgi:hypothetical protein